MRLDQARRRQPQNLRSVRADEGQHLGFALGWRERAKPRKGRGGAGDRARDGRADEAAEHRGSRGAEASAAVSNRAATTLGSSPASAASNSASPSSADSGSMPARVMRLRSTSDRPDVRLQPQSISRRPYTRRA